MHRGKFSLTDVRPFIGVLLAGLGIAGVVVTVRDIMAGLAGAESLGLFALLFLASGLLLWGFVRSLRQRVYVHEHGLIWTMGGKDRSFRWNDIESINGIRVLAQNGLEKDFYVRLKLRSGKCVTLRYVDKPHDLHALAAAAVSSGSAQPAPASP